MFPFKRKMPYRITLVILALTSLLAVADCYVSHGINAHYFPGQSHRKDFLPMVFFAALFIGFSLEIVSLVFFRKFTGTGNGKVPNHSTEPLSPSRGGSS